MNQVFKAVDSLDNELSLFHFDNEGGETIHSLEGFEEEYLIKRFRRSGCDWPEGNDSRTRMINPVLVAEW